MRTSHRNVIFECLCDCGNTVYVSGGCLRSGKIKSCGCYRIDHMRENRNEGFTHRLSQSRLYSVWSSIKCRCKNQSHPSYRNYGAKGITICEEWDNDFMEFYQWAMQTGIHPGAIRYRIDAGWDVSEALTKIPN